MRNLQFKDSNREYVQISKREAKKRFERGEAIDLCPCALRPGFPWAPQITIRKSDDSDRTFETCLSTFEYHNLGNGAGRYTMFYRNPAAIGAL